MNQFTGDFELFSVDVRRLVNGNKLCYVFEIPENLETEKKLIEFRGENVKASISQAYDVPEPKRIHIEGVFEVFEVKCRRLKNGDKLMFKLEQSYDKSNELKAVNLRFDKCSVSMQTINEELDFDQEDADLDREEVDV
jgi:hypothetical protein